jgi:DNA-binding winged helix-turn-helix (wHTH) protein
MPRTLRFAEFDLDPEARLLRRGGEDLHLGPKAFDLLALLIDRRPRVLTKAQLMEALWPRTSVTEANVTNLVGELRTVLGDDPKQPRFVRTAFGVGYAFAGQVEGEARPKAAPAGPRLLTPGLELLLAEGENVLGRDEALATRVDLPGVSRHHARLVIQDSVATVEDLGSKNGTFVNGSDAVGIAPLADGDRVALGRTVFVFRIAGAKDRTRTER